MKGLAVAAILLLAGAGCVVPESSALCEGVAKAMVFLPGAAATPAGAPLEIQFEVCKEKAFFGRGATLVLVAAPAMGTQTVTVDMGFVLPPNVVLAGGSLDWSGPVRSGEVQRLEATVRAGAAGTYILRGWAELPDFSTNGSRSAPRGEIGLRGGPEGVERFDPECFDRRNDCGFPEVRVDLDAAADNPSAVTGRFTAPTAMTGRAMFWSGTDLEEPWEIVPFDLAAGEPFQMHNTVRMPDDFPHSTECGYHQVHFHVYPHASLDSRVFTESVYYEADEGRIIVHHDQSPPCR